VPRGRADIANTALRIFLQEIGAAYDAQRGLQPYKKAKHFEQIKAFFDGRCCYCGTTFTPASPAVQDHLIPVNKTALGLHAWGNIVPACPGCNSKKHLHDWRDFIIERAGANATERHARVKAFLKEYGYKPPFDLRDVADELYDDVGAIAMTLVTAKVHRMSAKLGTSSSGF